MNDGEVDDDVGRAARLAAVIGVGLTAGAALLQGPRAAISVLAGAIVAIANLLVMRLIIQAFIPRSDLPAGAPDDEKPGPQTAADNAAHREAGRKGGTAWAIFAVLKIFILFGVLWFLLTRRLVDPMPLVVGYGVLPLGIAASALFPRR